MAYIDHRSGRNQRAAAAAVVALIQGAAIVALVNGFTVTFFERPPPERPTAEQIPINPIPVPPPPPEQASDRPAIEPTVLPRLPLPSRARPVDPVLPPPVPDAPPTPFLSDPIPLPSPTASFTPRAAKPRTAPGSWASADDYPARDLREGNQGMTRFALAIDASGRVQGCTIVASSGFPGLDKATCDKVSRRARFDPATDGEGRPVASTYISAIRWRIPQD